MGRCDVNFNKYLIYFWTFNTKITEGGCNFLILLIVDSNAQNKLRNKHYFFYLLNKCLTRYS
jgi:hypothetical protein